MTREEIYEKALPFLQEIDEGYKNLTVDFLQDCVEGCYAPSNKRQKAIKIDICKLFEQFIEDELCYMTSKDDCEEFENFFAQYRLD